MRGYYGDHCGSNNEDCTPYGGAGWSPVIRKPGNADAIKCGQIAVDCAGGIPSTCGNGTVEGVEQCDLGAANGACPATCSVGCTTNACTACMAGSDTFYGDPSECANTCCSGTCSSAPIDLCGGSCPTFFNTCDDQTGGVCGNNMVEVGEDCDEGAENGLCPRTCSSFCTANVCPLCVADGDKFYGDSAECASVCCNNTCSSSVPFGCGGSENTCATGAAFCGNGTIEAPEVCDNGDNNGDCPAACSATCATNTCATCVGSGAGFIGSGDPAECVSGCCGSPGSCSSIAFEDCGGYCSLWLHTCA